MSLIDLATARVRVPNLPDDDTAAQAMIDEEEARLARALGGPLTGSRVETFYVGGGTSFAGPFFGDYRRTRGKLSLSRYTDAVSVDDAGATVNTSRIKLIDRGSAIVLDAATAPNPYWLGPYVEVTYTPTDELEVQAALYELLGLTAEAASQPGGYQSETLGDYAYTRGAGGTKRDRAAIYASLVPKRDGIVNLKVSRAIATDDPVINRAEPWV